MEIALLANGIRIDNASNPNGQWYELGGNFALNSSMLVDLRIEFHLFVQSTLSSGPQYYYIDTILVRKCCDPEPIHGPWGLEENYGIGPTPNIVSVDCISTRPYPYVSSNVTRTNEPTMITANVSQPINGNAITMVSLFYRINSGEWWNHTMTLNTTSNLYFALIPAQQGNSSVDFYITASDQNGNASSSSIYTFTVKTLPAGDVNGDGVINMRDITFDIIHFNEHP
jgi:hypothetical protein